MPVLPTLPVQTTYRDVTDTFTGYDHEPKIEDGAFYDTQNLTTDYYPLMASRKRRGWVKNLFDPGGIMDKNYLAYVDEGILYINDRPTGLTGLTSGDKQLVGFGAYICIFPDKKYYNTADSTDYGSMDGIFSHTGTIVVQLYNSEDTMYVVAYHQSNEPSSPADGVYWHDYTNMLLKQWSAEESAWKTITDVHSRIFFTGAETGIQKLFKEGDEATFSDFPDTRAGTPATVKCNFNGTKTVLGVGRTTGYPVTGDYIAVEGVCISNAVFSVTDAKIERTIPDMDFVVECKNRLWGCKYGSVDGENVNEIYACKLGDFRIWNTYKGISTDPYAASVGSDGPWTGAINYMGYPTFFKEDRIHRVAVSATGAHEITETVCDGVQNGSGGSLAVINGILYYKTLNGIEIYQGGNAPTLISKALGDVKYSGAVAGVCGDKYYVSMKNASGEWSLFCYDSLRGLWIREDSTHVKYFAHVDDELYFLNDKNEIHAVSGSKGTLETNLDWYAESGMLYYAYPDRKYVSRFDLRLEMEKGSRIRIFIEYNSDGRWVKQGEIIMSGTNSRAIPIRPRRCDHCRIRVEGRGSVKLYSLARILEVGSDY